ncbi:ankyrin repeat domain-containing protein [Altererythrobacter sp. RZ02]|uniref:Ankyrin repeat domain-containing protein n=1 Tax=Pontixanthobacter rizhaonensis TaxID=2730337 RepID=A0A848QIY2_9SPHN|nr:ankyrin repeat domain-containing protein [Pontixanthobacter rizhaonensis]NMW30577.1 ankyrin repeat domain-containing protein [Pontixanthobacter rizhaonensis]
MASAVFPKFVLALGLAFSVAAPVSAQFYSDGYNFLKAIRDRDGEAVTKVLNEPGTVVVNTRDITTGETALHIVTARRDVAWVKFLAQKGANPNIRDKEGNTPLQIAASLGFIDGVEALLKAGANVDDNNIAGETPLISAVHKRDVGMVRLLLANNANPDRNDNSGRSARDYVELLSGNGLLLSEFTKADEERAASDSGVTYGPSF